MTQTLKLELEYMLAPGWMAPFVDGLLAGVARARVCGACKRISFPPQRTCPCGGRDGGWTALTGVARIIHLTTGADGAFALVRFDGADTGAVARVVDIEAGDRVGRLAPAGSKPEIVITSTWNPNR